MKQKTLILSIVKNRNLLPKGTSHRMIVCITYATYIKTVSKILLNVVKNGLVLFLCNI